MHTQTPTTIYIDEIGKKNEENLRKQAESTIEKNIKARKIQNSGMRKNSPIYIGGKNFKKKILLIKTESK